MPEDLLLNKSRAPSKDTIKKRLLAYRRLMAELINLQLHGIPSAYHQMSKSAFSYAPFGYDIFLKVVNSVELADLVIRKNGLRRNGESVATTFALTDEVTSKIETWCHSQGNEWSCAFVAQDITFPLIRAKYPKPTRRGRVKPQAKEVPLVVILKREDILSNWRRIELLNHFYKKHPITGVPFYGLHRIFNNYSKDVSKPLEGGRLYAIGGSYQILNSLQRIKLKIDDEPVCEIDIKSSHLVLSSFIKRATSATADFIDPLTLDDPYCFEEIPRSVVKAMVTLLIGSSGTSRTWTQEQRSSLLESEGINLKDYSFKKIRSTIEKSYGFVTGTTGQDISWGLLQIREADAVLSCIARLANEYDIAAYPVHDSIIVKLEDCELASKVLLESFRSIIGYEPKLSIR
ncbi:hypothetical protein [Marinobacterium sp. LSUCC0821]|uniref:hypothetical protein n=1 Tax=Marinobacterium sp. LSUCC0821 TaxID=2668067 RepID=UPI001451FC0D|nr:hypothetical protein [Marinobacterium sp. LSUCC0821]QJD70803.1 hypothetical protein HH196_03430 [Marinobacterium sp. LSUCC0821]